MLALIGPDPGRIPYTKVVDNVDTFLASINTYPFEKQSRSSDLLKVGVLLKFLDRSSYLENLDLQAYSNGKPTAPRIQGS
jgi:hypothetical protein